ISDPGIRLLRVAREAGVEVTVLPGPSAVETALVASGLAETRYAFVGFLPRRESERSALWAELAASPWPTVAFESPKRLPGTLRSLAAADPGRLVAGCRQPTERYEEVVAGPAAQVAERFAEQPKGEITLVIGGGGAGPDLEPARQAVADLVAAGTPRRVAADVVSRLTNTSRNDLYRGSL